MEASGASSSFAIAGAPESILIRLERSLEDQDLDGRHTIDEIQADYGALNETSEEWEQHLLSHN